MPLRIAVQGCLHGQLNDMYRALQDYEREHRDEPPIDLVLVCGDVETFRSEADLATMACPPKYRQLHDFPDYFAGRRRAPYPTVIIGGNHEASSYLYELRYGGWVAPNIYYMGVAGALRYGDLRIIGFSGIQLRPRGHGHTPSGPQGPSAAFLGPRRAYRYRDLLRPGPQREVYGLRAEELASLFHLSPTGTHPHCPSAQHAAPTRTIVISHDWPVGIGLFGDHRDLLSRKRGFRSAAYLCQLGSQAAAGLLAWLKPHYWFAAHHHVHFRASLVWTRDGSTPDHITRFMALAKITRHGGFLHVLDLPACAAPAPVPPPLTRPLAAGPPLPLAAGAPAAWNYQFRAWAHARPCPADTSRAASVGVLGTSSVSPPAEPGPDIGPTPPRAAPAAPRDRFAPLAHDPEWLAVLAGTLCLEPLTGPFKPGHAMHYALPRVPTDLSFLWRSQPEADSAPFELVRKGIEAWVRARPPLGTAVSHSVDPDGFPDDLVLVAPTDPDPTLDRGRPAEIGPLIAAQEHTLRHNPLAATLYDPSRYSSHPFPWSSRIFEALEDALRQGWWAPGPPPPKGHPDLWQVPPTWNPIPPDYARGGPDDTDDLRARQPYTVELHALLHAAWAQRGS